MSRSFWGEGGSKMKRERARPPATFLLLNHLFRTRGMGDRDFQDSACSLIRRCGRRSWEDNSEKIQPKSSAAQSGVTSAWDAARGSTGRLDTGPHDSLAYVSSAPKGDRFGECRRGASPPREALGADSPAVWGAAVPLVPCGRLFYSSRGTPAGPPMPGLSCSLR